MLDDTETTLAELPLLDTFEASRDMLVIGSVRERIWFRAAWLPSRDESWCKLAASRSSARRWGR